MNAAWRSRSLAALALCAMAGFSTNVIASGEMNGKVIWVDMKNSALLVECLETAACKDLPGNKGETFTIIIPDALKKAAESWKEGVSVKVAFEDRAEGGRTVKTVVPLP